MSIELVPLCTFVAELRKPHVLRGTPAGDRLIFEVASGSVSGERFNAKLKGEAAADWFVIGPDGAGTLDVRVLVETDDGALVFIQYHGRVDTTVPGAHVYSTPRFETGDERYLWLNKIQAVGKGTLSDGGNTLTYEIYEVR
jgi:hypothetical protein